MADRGVEVGGRGGGVISGRTTAHNDCVPPREQHLPRHSRYHLYHMPTKSALAANLVCWEDVVCFLACLLVVLIALQPMQCKASVCKSFCSIFIDFRF